jgi:hypothetical protein
MNSTAVQRSSITRPKSLEGLFSTVLGRTDYRSDGSYVTTQWLSALMVPMVPKASFRVRESKNLPKGTFHTCEEVRLCLRQVLTVYSFSAFCVMWALLIPFVASEYLLDKPIWLFLTSIMLMLWVPLAIRKAVRRRRRRLSRLNEAFESLTYRARA